MIKKLKQKTINNFWYKPDTDLKDGIAAFVKWYKNFYGVDNAN